MLTLLIVFALASCGKEDAYQPEPQQLTYRVTAGVSSVVTLKLHRAGITVRDTVYGQVMYYDEARPGDILSIEVQSLAGPRVGVSIEYGGYHLLYQPSDSTGYLKVEGRLPQ